MLLSESAALFCENGEFVMDKLDCVEVYKKYFFSFVHLPFKEIKD